MIGKFTVEHIRDGKVIRSLELENPITTTGVEELIELKGEEGCQSFVMNPSSGEFDLVVRGKNPLGRLISATVFTFPEPITLTGDDEIRIEYTPPEIERACGEAICECGKPYFDHPYAANAPRDYLDRQFIKQLCDGRLVKL